VRAGGGELAYLSEDAVSLNQLTVKRVGSQIEFRDPTVDGGLDPGSCDPGDITNDANAWIISVRCPTAGVNRLRIDLGDREDGAVVAVDLPVRLLGGPGADKVETGAGADAVSGDDGDDVLAAGAGADQVNAGDGDDEVRAGAGNDVVQGGFGADVVDGGRRRRRLARPRRSRGPHRVRWRNGRRRRRHARRHRRRLRARDAHP
jgi:hypothetical protein